VICRDATTADISWLARVALANYREVFAPLLPDCDWSSFDLDSFQARLGAGLPSLRMVVDDAGAGLGFSKMTERHIDMFFIDRALQSRGAGAVLLDDAVERGARSLECFARNTGARRFYERHGWRMESAYGRAFAGADCDFVRYALADPRVMSSG
jgi:putative acetyltransferase